MPPVLHHFGVAAVFGCQQLMRHQVGQHPLLVLVGQIDFIEAATTIGTLPSRAWLKASTVWGMTPSLAATTSTAMSVTFAPRARISPNAA